MATSNTLSVERRQEERAQAQPEGAKTTSGGSAAIDSGISERGGSFTDRDAIRRALLQQAGQQGQATQDLGLFSKKVEQFVNSTFDNPDLRGVALEKRHQAFNLQLQKLAQDRNLTPQQQDSLRQEFLKLDTERMEQRTLAIARKVSEISRRDSDHIFDQEQMKERLAKACDELRVVAGKATPEAEWQAIVASLLQGREDERRALMMKEIASLGKSSGEPGVALDRSAVKEQLLQIRQRYADVTVADPNELLSAFQVAYDREFDQQLSQRGFIERNLLRSKRMFSDVKSWCIEDSSLAQSLKGAAGEAKAALYGAGKLGKDMLGWGHDKVVSAVSNGANFAKVAINSPTTAVEIATSSAGQAIGAATSSINWIFGKGVAGGNAVVSGVAYGARRGLELGTLVAQGEFRAAGAILSGGLSAVKDVGYGVYESFGGPYMVAGVSHFAMAHVGALTDVVRIAGGSGTVNDLRSNYRRHLVSSLKGVQGLGICLGTVTGITDAAQTVKHSGQALCAYGRGDQVGATFHLAQAGQNAACAALSAGSIMATVSTGGAAAASIVGVATLRVSVKEAAKEVLKVGAREFLEHGAREIGESTVKMLGSEALQLVEKRMGTGALEGLRAIALKELGEGASEEMQRTLLEQLAFKELCKDTGSVMALEGAERLAAQVQEQGSQALTSDSATAVMREVGEQRTAELLEALKLSDTVQELTKSMLVAVSSRPREAAKELVARLGVSQKEATKMVKEMNKGLRSGVADDAMKQILEDGITLQVKQALELNMKESFEHSFKGALKGQVDTPWARSLAQAAESQAKQLGKGVDEFTEELATAGWKGAREGIESATRKAVREGVERGFNEFRKGRGRSQGAARGVVHATSHHEDLEQHDGDLEDHSKGTAEQSQGEQGGSQLLNTKVVTVELGEGRYERQTMAYNPASKQWELQSKDSYTTAA